MSEFYEIDFLEVGEKASGDAIGIRYSDVLGNEHVHVVDGGYTNDGAKLRDHIKSYYGNPTHIDNVILTHPDGDHAQGLKTILEEFDIGALWMNRPWNHVEALVPLFEYEYTLTGLTQRLKKDFPFTRDLELIADKKNVVINDAFRGHSVGPFTILAPSYNRYIDLIVESERTPEPERKSLIDGSIFERAFVAIKNVIVEWGHENLKGDTEGTSRENESSIIQFAEICGDKILLTGDVGVEGLEEAYEYAVSMGIQLPGLNRFDVPHHGSRRNLSSDILDKWLGPKHSEQKDGTFSAIVSANKNDKDHPRKAVTRALIHRGAQVAQTHGTVRSSKNAPEREGWYPITPMEYPNDTEE